MFILKKVLNKIKKKSTKEVKTKQVKQKVHVDNYIDRNNRDVQISDYTKSLVDTYLTNCSKDAKNLIKDWYIVKCTVNSTMLDITNIDDYRLVVKSKGNKRHYVVSINNSVILDVIV